MVLKNASHRKGLICVLLAVLTLAAYCPVLRNDFINFDDRPYILENPHVLTGLNWANAKWAFTTGYASNWHPLTWLSHQLDVQIFGLRPQWHHLENLLFHIANSILLFLVLLAATDARRVSSPEDQTSNALPQTLWRCVFVAALFAVHPLHVESVAWAAERKDVLSTFFFLLTLWAYVHYAQAREAKPPAPDGSVALPGSAASGRSAMWRHYALALLFYALGLLSKPMLVTTPFVLLLLDYWPLSRLSLGNQNSEIKIQKFDIANPESAKFLALRSACKLVLEKVPFFLLAAASSLITFLVQRAGHATSQLEGLPFEPRITNTVISYFRYMGKMVWPAKLAAFYPHPGHWGPAAEPPDWMVCGAALALVAITVWVASRRQQQPWLAVGWFWYVGTLVPVIGLVQVGGQAIADRYMYIPSIGLFIAAVWWVTHVLRGESDIQEASPPRTPVPAQGLRPYALAAAGVVLVLVEAVVSNTQVRYWHDTFSLFQHTAAVTKNNQVALLKLSEEYAAQGKPDLALKYVRMSLEADPNFDSGYYTLGLMAVQQGNLEEAVEAYQKGLKVSPWNAKAHNELGVALLRLGRTDEAGEQLKEAARLSPNSASVHYNLGLVYAAREQHSEAASEFAEAARLHTDADTLAHLSGELLTLGRLDEAETRCRERVRLDPKNPEVHERLATVFQLRGKLDQALESFNEAVRLQPVDLAAHIGLGRTFALQGKFAQAQSQFRQANQLASTNTQVLLLLGDALMVGGQTNESAAVYASALKLDPDLARKNLEVGKQLAAKGQLNEACSCLLTATLLNPKDADAHQSLGEILSQQGRLDEGAKELQSAIRLCLKQDQSTPQAMLAHAYYDLAMVRSLQGRPNEAVDCYRQALGVDTNYLAALNNLAWLLATDPHDAVRNGAEAVRLAERARDLSGGKEARYWGTLDAAYAEAGRWPDATLAARKAIELAESAGQKDLADAARKRSALYQEHKAWRH